jgi:hypothetical protein
MTLLLAGAAWAQEKHEVHLSVSGPAGGMGYDAEYGSLYNWGTDLYSMYEPGERVDTGPVFSLGYTYAVRSWLRVGAEGSLGIIWADKSQPRAWGDGVVSSSSQRLYTVMPLVHFVALDKRHIKIYGKVAVGAQLSMGDYEPTILRPAFQFVPFGLQWGGEKVFALAELGFGNVYSGRVGIGLRW